MALVQSVLKADISARIETDAKFATDLYNVSKKAMDRFQSAQKQAQMNAGTVAGFTAAQQVASIAFAMEMKKLQGVIADTVSKNVSAAVHTYTKTAQVIIPAPLNGAGGGPAPVVIPVVPPGSLV